MHGCYLGAFVDREHRLQPTFMDNDQRYGDPGQEIGKKHGRLARETSISGSYDFTLDARQYKGRCPPN